MTRAAAISTKAVSAPLIAGAAVAAAASSALAQVGSARSPRAPAPPANNARRFLVMVRLSASREIRFRCHPWFREQRLGLGRADHGAACSPLRATRAWQAWDGD